MRKLFALTLLLLGAFVLLGAQGITLGKGATYGKGMTVSPGAAAAPSAHTFRQACQTIGGSGTTILCTFGVNPTSTDLVFCGAYSPSTYSTYSASDGGSTWVNGTQYNNASNFITQVFYTLSWAGSGATVTLTNTFTAGQNFMVCTDYSGTVGAALDANTLDATTRAQLTTTSSNPLSNAATPANATVTLIGLLASTNGRTYSLPTDGQGDTVTIRTTTGTYPMVIEDANVTIAKSYAMGATISSPDDWNVHFLAFK